MGDDQSEETRSVASSRRLSALASCDSRTLIVWVEDWDDIDHVPVDQLAQEATTGEEPLQDRVGKSGTGNPDLGFLSPEHDEV